MKPNALLSVLLVIAVSPSCQESVFEVIRSRIASAPAAFKSLPGFSPVDCSMKCAQDAACIGFGWLQGLCKLFDLASLSNAWQSSDNNDLYVNSIAGGLTLPIEGCNQSSIYTTEGPVYNSFCHSAMDGNRSQIVNFCSITNGGPNEWWEAQLTSQGFVKYVTIYNNKECCPQYLNAFSLLVDGVECNRVYLTESFSVANFSCNAFGSRVRVQSLLNTHLVICEVEIYGY